MLPSLIYSVLVLTGTIAITSIVGFIICLFSDITNIKILIPIILLLIAIYSCLVFAILIQYFNVSVT